MARVRAGAAAGGGRRRGGSVKVIVTGHRRIDRKLRALEPKVQKKVLRQAMRKNLKPVVAEAKGNAPRDVGILAKEIRLVAGKRSRRWPVRFLVIIRPEDLPGLQYYANFPEYGSTNQDPQKYMYLAAKENRKPYQRAMVKALWAGIKAEAEKG